MVRPWGKAVGVGEPLDLDEDGDVTLLHERIVAAALDTGGASADRDEQNVERKARQSGRKVRAEMPLDFP